MPKTSYSDIVVVHRYLDEIVTLVRGIVGQESISIVIACQVLEDYCKSNALYPFGKEEDREQWLRLKAHALAHQHLKRERHEKIKSKAIRTAIHDCS